MKSGSKIGRFKPPLTEITTAGISRVFRSEEIDRLVDGQSGHADPLTGLATRQRLIGFLDALLAVKNGPQIEPALLLLDLDRFKNANDAFGPLVCDAVLRSVAQRLQSLVKDALLIARVSGDGFAVLIKDKHSAPAIAARLLEFLRRSYAVNGQVVNLGVSIGLCDCQTSHKAMDWLQDADTALHEAQRVGGNRFLCFDATMRQRVKVRNSLEVDLRTAVAGLRYDRHSPIAGLQFELNYQPQVAFARHRLTGFEALLRWRHPVHGLVPPDQFIPLAEELGLIGILGDWVIHTACCQAMDWPQSERHPALRVAVNVSPLQLRDGRAMLGSIHKALIESGLPAERLEIEITETALEDDIGDTLAKIRLLGIELALDDFGTGYSSLGRLLQLPFNRIKIDRSFVADINLREPGLKNIEKVISAIASLGAALGMTTIVEGIETVEQVSIVQRTGCTEMQGYLISRPVPANEVGRLIQRLEQSYFKEEPCLET